MNPHPNDPKGQAGAAKTPLHLIPTVAMTAEAEALRHGAEKYQQWNWRESGIHATTYIGSILRHLVAWRDGEDVDPESGISHLGHIRANCAILLDAAHVGKLVDDRPVHRVEFATREELIEREQREFAREQAERDRLRVTIPPSTEPPYTVEQLTKVASEPMLETNKSFMRRGTNPDYIDAPKEEIRGTMVNGKYRSWEESGVPDGLPPLPPVPEGFDRWVYRGTGWKSEGRVPVWAYCFNHSEWTVRKFSLFSPGGADGHYVEAVND